MRLAKYLAHAGVASRRAAETLIAAGRVSVDGEVVTDPARDVGEAQRVARRRAPVGGPEPRVAYALHKPAGVVSTARDTHGRPTVVELVPTPSARLYPGRTPGRRQQRPDPAHQRRRARQPADAPALRGAEDLPRDASAAGAIGARAGAAARRRRARGRRHRAGARTPRGPGELELTIHEGATARCGACARQSVIRCVR